jgi:hypothetical protein
MSSVPYVGAARAGIPTPEELRARIPGWGADLDPADRPSVPRELADGIPEGVHWDVPADQPELERRERSVEHARLTPVFGTSSPPRGVSGAVRRLAYARYSEARAAHWLLLLAADRIESKGHALRSMLSRRPDDPVTETGVVSELRGGNFSSRFGQGRVDLVHHPLDPALVLAPWVVSAWAGWRAVRRLRGTFSGWRRTT